MNLSINLKGFKEGVTIGDLKKVEKEFNSLFNSPVLQVREGESHLKSVTNTSCTPFSAEELVEELKVEKQ